MPNRAAAGGGRGQCAGSRSPFHRSAARSADWRPAASATERQTTRRTDADRGQPVGRRCHGMSTPCPLARAEPGATPAGGFTVDRSHRQLVRHRGGDRHQTGGCKTGQQQRVRPRCKAPAWTRCRWAARRPASRSARRCPPTDRAMEQARGDAPPRTRSVRRSASRVPQAAQLAACASMPGSRRLVGVALEKIRQVDRQTTRSSQLDRHRFNASRNRSRARCSCAFVAPGVTPSISAISSCL